ncbi:B-cell receptor CD22-like [Osmerus mordax]|uniref:B-cell receptor CD22-like n=1 Tax=Osmerus mordax TaxID=8014 RepID=UPI00350F245E
MPISHTQETDLLSSGWRCTYSMVLRTSSVLVVLIWSLEVAVVQSQNGQKEICVLKGSSVDLPCSYRDPSGVAVAPTGWYSRWDSGADAVNLSQNPQYTGRVEYRWDEKSDCTLRIKNLSQSDSAEYHFRFNTEKWDGTILTVTDLQVEVTTAVVTDGQKVTLTCSTTCPLSGDPSYIWYKNGQFLTSSQTGCFDLDQASIEDTGNYSCSVRYEKLQSSVVIIDVRYKPKNVTIFVSSHGDIVEGRLVTLTCSSDANPPVVKYTWYKENVTISKGEDYTIMNISSEHSGGYYCEAQNEVGFANSTTYMVPVFNQSSFKKSVIVSIITIVGLTLTFLLVLPVSLWLWKRKTSNPSSIEQDNLYYASITFSRPKNQDEVQYSTVQPSQIQNQDGDVEYSILRFSPPSAAPRAQFPEDPSATYSTVNKART